MLAQRISSINSFSAICEKTGANIDELSKAIGMDHRIGPKFLRTSVGFGGSCFKKDILNLVYLCKHYSLNEIADYWHNVIKINDYQKNRFAQKIIKALGGDLEGKKITILGWAFKPNTNDSRESPAIEVTKILFDAGAIIDIYDPLIKSQKIIDDIKTNWNISIDFKKIKILKNLLEIDRDTKAIAVISECESFKKIDFSKYRLFEARNFLRELNPKS